MKKSIMFALLGMLFIGGPTVVFAQGEDSTDVTTIEEPKDTISIDNTDPKFYEEETPAKEESSSTMTYIFVGGIVVIGGAAFFYIRKKKK
jgi:LPXTG-motif cell wall-anchored protein